MEVFCGTGGLCAAAWNDLKNSLKQSKGKLYKVLLQYSLVFNLGYGPANTKKWSLKKQHLFEWEGAFEAA